MNYNNMKRLYILILAVLFIVAVPVQTFGQSGFFDSSKSEDTNSGSNSEGDSNSGFFRVGSTENPTDSGGATKESELPSDAGNGIIIASVLFAASYTLVKIRKDKKKMVVNC